MAEYSASPSPAASDEEAQLQSLTVGARNQDDLERDIGRQAERVLKEQSDKRDQKRMEKVQFKVNRFQVDIQSLRSRLFVPQTEAKKRQFQADILEKQKSIDELNEELDTIQQRINDRQKSQFGVEDEDSEIANGQLPNETRREFLIRTGKITPFSKLTQSNAGASNLEDAMIEAEVEESIEEPTRGPISHQHLMQPGFEAVDTSSDAGSTPSEPRPSKRMRFSTSEPVTSREGSSAVETPGATSDDAYNPNMSDRQLAALGDTDDASDAVADDDDDYEHESVGSKRKVAVKSKKSKSGASAKAVEDMSGIDDGKEKVYQTRLKAWTKQRASARRHARATRGIDAVDQHEDEWNNPHPTEADGEFDDGFRVPGDIYPALFDYQKTGVQWLWELYSQNVGGIVGDEMGLGKTIQAVSFIAGLHYSKMLHKPVIVVCPATVMKQWVNEFHRWWPALRVSILHGSGSGMLDTRREDRIEREMDLGRDGDDDAPLTRSGRSAKRIVEKVQRDGHVLITTYAGLQTYAEFLIPVDWETAILDEGHKIRNPNTSITIHCKELRTSSRIILSGTPMQNNLTELWSLFDFVFPMRLGTLVSFRQEFEDPIKRGGYANASQLEFETAARCAETLKDAISPYLLQRFKADVAADLPKKKEQVIFCKLTRQQRMEYERFLGSGEMASIVDGKRQALFGIDWLRKVCNHPDLIDHKNLSKRNDGDYGAGHRSGKMQVVKNLLSLWKKGNHKTLLFAQHRIMLDILEKYIQKMPGFKFLRMDGNTPIKQRQGLVDQFNSDPDIHVFLLTTKVGGLGVNLTGADRVIIYDPDWNPSTDVQARERSWRLGQKREVEIYRLMSAGTIEEKIYHRQIFKQFLTNKVMKDPKSRQTFAMSDLHDLFSLGNDMAEGETETGNLFRGSGVQFRDSEGSTTKADLEAVAGIDHTEAFNPTGSSPSSGQDEPEDGKTEDRLLTTIFAKSGIHAIHEHDSIMGTATGGHRRKVFPNTAFVQQEAMRTANRAANLLRKAEEQARQLPVGIPTWTGTAGTAGRPVTPPPRHRPLGFIARQTQVTNRGGGTTASRRGATTGLGSSSVLSGLSTRQAPRPTSATATPALSSSAQRLVTQIRDFLRDRGGVASSLEITREFDSIARQEGMSNDEFKECLKAVARLERGGGRGRNAAGRWVLKEEYREGGGGVGSGQASRGAYRSGRRVRGLRG
ncbi:DNA repair protein-like protein Rhp26/Rad26 [Amniculicola lignicola CBS 123094]|uniref:DNA repair protein-like protein Rhp26/Rad26 n=1 Tax=Amniculicola lignicola CBS 123094 TaxID=1392246 RepID=A0A6A5WD49_9PLEO|nr:DNA repair protein-like protein Rhp26/Rad26 [Amniculicola lignicola CBS 123094]